MAPESPGNLITLDLQWNGSRLECDVDRYDDSGGFLYVSWNAIACPENYVPIGNGVAYVWVPKDGFTNRRYRARVNRVGDGFEWPDVGQTAGAMVIVTLPPRLVYAGHPEHSPQWPVDFKTINEDRMALYWWQHAGRFSVFWRMEPLGNASIHDECDRLRVESRHQSRRGPDPVHIDRPLVETAVQSQQVPVLLEPPEQHTSLVVGQIVFGNVGSFMNQEKVISIGANARVMAPITVADSIANSFNVLRDSSVNDDVKQALEELLRRVIDVARAAPTENAATAQRMSGDAETLVKEAASPSPRRAWYEMSLAGVREAATAIGEIAQPVLDVVAKLTPLLLR